ncbi:MAG TPA: FtsW/RodA/SpoVE family cell cycle protein, partial [Phycisphaerae bacterium]
ARRESAPPRRVCDTADLRRRPHSVMLRFRTVLFGAAAIGICAGLVGIEDFGTAALLAAVGGLMLLAGGARLAHLALLALPGLAAFAYLLIAKPYRLERLTAFRNIWADPRGQGYHAIQSLATIASGGWFGRGLGNGVQKFGYLPEARTDFIFSVICEETGLFGAFVVMLLFAGLVWLGIACVRAAPTALGRLLALGITLLIGLQAAMNVAVVTVAAPTKGIALPLVSAGGSGILFLGAAIGLAASVAYHASSPAAAGDTDCGLRNANCGLDNPQSAIRNPQSAGAMA